MTDMATIVRLNLLRSGQEALFAAGWRFELRLPGPDSPIPCLVAEGVRLWLGGLGWCVEVTNAGHANCVTPWATSACTPVAALEALLERRHDLRSAAAVLDSLARARRAA